MSRIEAIKALLESLERHNPAEYSQFMTELLDRYGVDALIEAFEDLLNLPTVDPNALH